MPELRCLFVPAVALCEGRRLHRLPRCSSGQSHIPVVLLRSAPTEPHSSSTSSQCSVPPSFLFLFQTSFLFFFCQTSFLFLSFLSRYCHTRYCHIWVLGGHLILFILFCAWSWVTALSPVLQQVAALPSTRTNQMSLSGSPVSSIGLRDRDAECRGMLLVSNKTPSSAVAVHCPQWRSHGCSRERWMKYLGPSR